MNFPEYFNGERGHLLVKATKICVVAAIILYPLTYIGNYGGDSQVHLVYGQNAAAGGVFEFNPGEKSPGVTSPGYMMMLAAYFQLFPDAWVPAVVKATNLIFWYGLIFLVFILASSITRSVFWAGAAALAAGLLPGSVYNGTNGMENGIFAFFIFFWVYAAMRTGWFVGGNRSNYPNEFALGLIMGMACWVRPEGFVIGALALLYRAFLALKKDGEFRQTILDSAVFLSPFLVITGGLAYFHWHHTGHLLPVSGTSRILMSNLDPGTLRLGAINFSPKFTIRLVQYFPLTLPALLAGWLLITGRLRYHESARVLGFLALLAASFFVLYSLVLGSTHLSRYIIFVMPAVILLAAVGGNWAWEAFPSAWSGYFRFAPVAGFAAMAVVLGAVFAIETDLRLKLDTPASLWVTMKAPSQRAAFGDEFLSQMGSGVRLPISVAMQEVQARYWMDDRFVVRSLDGRIDPLLTEYSDGGGIDHVGYIKEREVQYLIDTPNYNRDKSLWSLDRLANLGPDEEISRSGTTFRRLAIDRSNRDEAMRAERNKSRWAKGSDGVIRAHFFLIELLQISHEDQ